MTCEYLLLWELWEIIWEWPLFIYFVLVSGGPHVEVSGRSGESVLSTMWVLGIELSSLSLATSSVHPLSYFVGPDFQVSISNFFALSRMANFIKWHLFLIPLPSCFYKITFYFSIGTSYSYKMPLRFFSTCFFFWQGFAIVTQAGFELGSFLP